jgi:hypothetical protein
MGLMDALRELAAEEERCRALPSGSVAVITEAEDGGTEVIAGDPATADRTIRLVFVPADPTMAA